MACDLGRGQVRAGRSAHDEDINAAQAPAPPIPVRTSLGNDAADT